MVRTLQKKFIFAAMLSVTLVMVCFLAALNILNYAVTKRDTSRTLDLILSANVQETPGGGAAGERPESEVPNEVPDGERPETGANPPEVPEEDLSESIGSAQYFFVRLAEDGRVIYTELGHVTDVTAEEAAGYAAQAAGSSGNEGQCGSFFYRKQEDRVTGGSVCAFLDAGAETRALARTLLLTLLVGAVSWFLVLLLVIGLSRRAIRPVAESIEKQKRFITDAGHEIKTPLAIIRANADALELFTGENKWIRNIQTQTDRLGTLTANLLALSRMEEMSGRMLPAEDFDAAAVLYETAASFDEKAESRGLLTEISVCGKAVNEETVHRLQVHLPKEVYARTLSILYDNAVKYADEGGFIRTALTKEGRTLTLVMTNSCADLPAAEPERLFDRFFRPDESRNRKSGGSGIGLSTAKALAEGAGGSIRAEYGKGSISFTLRLKERT